MSALGIVYEINCRKGQFLILPFNNHSTVLKAE